MEAKNKIFIIIVLVIFFVILYAWITDSKQSKKINAIIKEREENLYKKSTFCKCKEPKFIDRETTTCFECDLDFTYDSIVYMRENAQD